MRIHRHIPVIASVVTLGLAGVCSAPAQSAAVLVANPTPAAASASTAVPALVPYSGIALGSDGKPLAGAAAKIGMTFLIFKDEQGGEPLWTETQGVEVDSLGSYKVQLGAASPSGLPLETFSSGQARWLEIQIAGEQPQPRVLLSSVPYALKAADSATLGGLPASAFVLAGSPNIAAQPAASGPTPDTTFTVTTTGGTSGYLPSFTGASAIANSEIYDTGTSVGIGDVPNPTVKLDVNGAIIMRGAMIVSRTGNATAAKGFPSYGFEFFSNVYNSTSDTNDNPYFQLQSEPTGNNTGSPSATFNLLFANNGGAIAETGLYINPNGTINFAPGQTFPTNVGTITGVTAGTGLTGGGTSGNVTLTVNPATVPELAAANTFTNTQTIASGDLNLPATTSSSSGVITIGGRAFLHGYTSANANVFVGGAGNFTTTGSHLGGVGLGAVGSDTTGTDNTAAGWAAGEEISSGSFNSGFGSASLFNITTGTFNTGMGYYANGLSLTGSYNTGIGAYSLDSLTTGNENTAIGYGASPGTSSGTISDSTAVGAFSTVSQSNSLILGQTYQGNPGFNFVNVGIGTDTPRSILEAAASYSNVLGPALTLTNSGSGSNTAAAVDFNTYLPSTTGTYNPGARIAAIDDGFSDDGTNLYFYTNKVGAANNGLRTDMVINSNYGAVGIGLTDPQSFGYQLVAEAANGVDAIYGAGSTSSLDYYSSIGVVGQGGNNTSGGYSAGDGGIFFGGDASGSSSGGDGVYGSAGSGGSAGYAGYFYGNVEITGTLNGAAPEVKIDDPVDPANKYLVQASVQSSEMMNIYSGNVVTDELGIATVTLPDWFQSENADFRYQLTVIGQFAQAIVSQEIKNNKFMISTNAQHVKVSWQVTGVRQDAYAKANPLVVEPAKPVAERGFYMHPELYGQPAEKQTEWARQPNTMRRIEEQRQKAKLTAGLVNGAIQPQLGPPASAVNRKFTTPAIKPLKPVAALKP